MDDALNRERLATTLGRGVASGLAGTVVMTGFQRYVEMPLTKRKESYAPADMVQRLLPIRLRFLALRALRHRQREAIRALALAKPASAIPLVGRLSTRQT